MSSNEGRVATKIERAYAATEELATVCNEFAGAWRDGHLERADVDTDRLENALEDAQRRLESMDAPSGF